FSITPDIAGTYNYTWSPAGIMNNDTISNPTGTFNTPGTFNIYGAVDNGGGCTRVDTFTVNVSIGAKPTITMMPDSATICGSDPVQLDMFVAGSSLSCQETATATGQDDAATTVTINNFSCVPAGSDITGMTMDADIGGNCPNWYTYDIIINGTSQFTAQCNQTGLDLTPFLPINSVEIVSNDEDAFSDGVTMNLILNISYSVSPHNYVWTPSLNLSDSSIKNPLASPPTPTTYYVTVTDTLGGCFDTDSVYVSVGNDFIASAAVDTSICIYNGIAENIQLEATTSVGGTYTYDWNNGGTLSDSTISNPIASPTSTTDYIVTIMNPAGCERTDTASITVFNTTLPLLIQGDPNYCLGDSAMLYVGNYTTYEWHNTIDTSIVISTTDTNYLFAGQYTVTVSLNGCSATSDTITVNEVIVTAPVLTDTSFCVGSSVQIDAGTGYSNYQWSPSGGNGAGAQFGNITSGGFYSVTVDSTSGATTCSVISNTIEVIENAAPSPQIIGDLTYCSDDSTILSSNISYNSYLWTPSNLTSNSITAGAGQIILRVDSNNCFGYDTVTVIALPTPNFLIFGTDSLCPDTSSGSLSVDNLTFDSYLWSPSGSTLPTTPAGAGTHTVTVTQNGCSSTSTSTIYSYPTPNANFTANPGAPAQPQDEIVFTDASSSTNSITSWIWDFDATNIEAGRASEFNNPQSVGPGHTMNWAYGAQGTYSVTLTVIDDNGCYNSTNQEYLVFSNIIIPNVITPNGDGFNDVLEFVGLDGSVFPNNLSVYNRWGNQVFNKADYQNDWDGGVLSVGTYFFILEVEFNTGKEVFKGSLNL
ncbi:gliding motility-associated C-terminal domain-containing protein, partial [Vicingaceae bacterium]|nr:gliding motility-associated C-terminal domain-containing protein [Vicingaceae bacterium]